MSNTWNEYTTLVGGKSLHCRSLGDGEALVWAHALLSSMDHEDRARVFDWSDLADRGKRWVRYDARSHGLSDEDENAAHLEWPNLAKDMVAVADRSDLTTFAAGGVSMGCATALWCAHTSPVRINRLVLALPPTAWVGRRGQAAFYRTASLGARMRMTLPLHLGRRFVPSGSTAANRAGYFRSILASVADMSPIALAAALGGAAASDMPPIESLTEIDAPALILGWKGDRSHPVSVARMLDDTLPNATLVIADDGDDVGRWAELVADFIAA